jgi:branched-chain amino acid transport system ATP-binding protein
VSALLEVTELAVSYGAVRAVENVSVSVHAGDVVAVLGANGAGKTSTVSAVSGLVKPAGGRVVWDGKDMTGWPAHRVARAGLTLVPEGRRVFAPMSVDENLLMGAYANASKSARSVMQAKIYEMFPILAERRKTAAGLLSGGEQQMLAFGRALMSEPRLIMMDEPSIGLAPAMVDRIMEAIADIAYQGIGVLLVEQNARAALEVATSGIVLQRGVLALRGTSAELRSDPGVVAAFLGQGGTGSGTGDTLPVNGIVGSDMGTA